MSHQYQNQRENRTGHQGQGGDRGRNRGRGRGGWHREQQGASKSPSGHWQNEGPGNSGHWRSEGSDNGSRHRQQRNFQRPSPSGQQWHEKGPDGEWNQEQQRSLHKQLPPGHLRNKGPSGSWGEQKRIPPVGSKDMTGQWNQKSWQRNPQSPFPPNTDGMNPFQGQLGGEKQHEQREHDTDNRGRFPTDQTFVHKPFVAQQEQLPSQQNIQMPPFNQTPPPPSVQGYPGVHQAGHSSQMPQQMVMHPDQVPAGQPRLIRQPDSIHQSQLTQGQPHVYQQHPNRTPDSIHQSQLTQGHPHAYQPHPNKTPDSIHQSQLSQGQPHAYQPHPNRTTDSIHQSQLSQGQPHAYQPHPNRTPDSIHQSQLTQGQPHAYQPHPNKTPDSIHQAQLSQGHPHAYQPHPNTTQQSVQHFASENSGDNQIQPPQAFQPPHSNIFRDSPVPMPPSVEHSSNAERNSIHSGMLDVDHMTETSKTQHMIDKEWIGQFLAGVRRAPCLPGINGEQVLMPISEGKRVIREYLELLGRLEECRDSLAGCMDSDEATWQQQCSRANQIKGQLQQVQCKLKDASFVPQLQQRIAKTKKKRESIARRKKRQFLAHEEEQDRKRRVNEKIDAVLAKEQKAIEDAKNEAALQKEVDSTLFEVKKKKHDADKTIEMLRALRKLRQLRAEAAARKGVYTTVEEDKQFDEGVSKLEVLMSKARRTYLEEQQTLLVMLEEEHEENKERQMEILRQRQRDSALRAVQRRKELLFGQEELVGPDDPLFPFQQFYSQAENNLHSLVEIRKQWDSFLVAPNDQEGSGIPTDWVIPAEPSSKEWASVLQDT